MRVVYVIAAGYVAAFGGLETAGCAAGRGEVAPRTSAARAASPAGPAVADHPDPQTASRGAVGSGGADRRACGRTRRCEDERCCFRGRCVPPICCWSLRCLSRLRRGRRRRRGGRRVNPRRGAARVATLTRMQARLWRRPERGRCAAAAERLARLYASQPWRWKRVCGPPPHPAVRRAWRERAPFTVLRREISGHNLPASAPTALRRRHRRYPDLCRARVQIRFERAYQGWVGARLFVRHSCTRESYERRQRNPALPPDCQRRPYARTARAYVPYHPAGRKAWLTFYFSTPPPVCLVENLNHRHFPRGCYCLGLADDRIELVPREDPFLFGEPIPPPHPRAVPRRCASSRPCVAPFEREADRPRSRPGSRRRPALRRRSAPRSRRHPHAWRRSPPRSRRHPRSRPRPRRRRQP
jgi:hypothetical protein